jgi:hypothetical protein
MELLSLRIKLMQERRDAVMHNGQLDILTTGTYGVKSRRLEWGIWEK